MGCVPNTNTRPTPRPRPSSPCCLRVPVRRDDRGAGEIPTLGRVVVEERLNQHLVDITLAFTGKDQTLLIKPPATIGPLV